jgi:hypothetical protein
VCSRLSTLSGARSRSGGPDAEPQICSAPMTVIAFRSMLGMVRAECFSVQFFSRIAPANLLGFAGGQESNKARRLKHGTPEIAAMKEHVPNNGTTREAKRADANAI